VRLRRWPFQFVGSTAFPDNTKKWPIHGSWVENNSSQLFHWQLCKFWMCYSAWTVLIFFSGRLTPLFFHPSPLKLAVPARKCGQWRWICLLEHPWQLFCLWICWSKERCAFDDIVCFALFLLVRLITDSYFLCIIQRASVVWWTRQSSLSECICVHWAAFISVWTIGRPWRLVRFQ